MRKRVVMSNVDPVFQQEFADFQRRLDSMQGRSAEFLKAVSEARLQADLEEVQARRDRRPWPARVVQRLRRAYSDEAAGNQPDEENAQADRPTEDGEEPPADIIDPPYTVHD